MNNNLNTALAQALEKEFEYLDNFNNPYEHYKFSEEFNEKIKNICAQSEYKYVSIDNRQIRKKMVIILIAALALLITGCGIAVHHYINWIEEQNDEYGTLDVWFEIDENLPERDIEFIYPDIPDEYKEVDKIENSVVFMIDFENSSGEVISFCQQIGLENMGLSINNETEAFEEITVNGYKGYYSEGDGQIDYVWTDGYCLYTLQGTCSNEILWEITKSIKLPE